MKRENPLINDLFSYKDSDSTFLMPGSTFSKIVLNKNLDKFKKGEKFDEADIFWHDGILTLSRMEKNEMRTYEFIIRLITQPLKQNQKKGKINE